MLVNKIKLSDLDTSDGFLHIPLSDNFSSQTSDYMNIENDLGLSNSDIINAPIDYEKVKIQPTIFDNVIKDVDSLRFNLHFYNNGSWDIGVTKLKDLGFTEDDVRNKSNRLKKTFIRLSFYDSKDFKTQNLLGYSNIFVDINYLYREYLYSGQPFSSLNISFIVENPRLSSKIKSFEGYYLYLFKDDLSKKSDKTIYMKVEFNNALNGRSVLFTRYDQAPKLDGYTMKELFDMMFFSLTCKYEADKGRYIWYFNDDIGKTLVETPPDLNDVKIKNVLNIELNQAKVI